MTNNTYVLKRLILSGFRAFLVPQELKFDSNRSLAVFARNGLGKSSIVDALEFMFSGDGTICRLGLRATDNRAGFTALSHNLAEERGIEPHVAAVFKLGQEEPVSGSRSAVGSIRPRPAIADDISACFVVDPIIRGHELRQFVEEQTAEQRYENVVHWLNLGPLVAVQSNIRALRRQTTKVISSDDTIDQIDTQLASMSDGVISEWDDANVLQYVNEIITPLDKDLALKALDRSDLAFKELEVRAKDEENRLGLEGLRLQHGALISLYQEKQDPDTDSVSIIGHIPEFEHAIETFSAAKEKESAERVAAANAVFAKLWLAAEPLFAEGEPEIEICPICDTPIRDSKIGTVEGIREHLASHLAQLSAYNTAKKSLDETNTKLKNLQSQLAIDLENLMTVLPDEYTDMKSAISIYSKAVSIWSDGSSLDSSILTGLLLNLTLAMEANIRDIEEEQGEHTYKKSLDSVEEILDLHEEREKALSLLAQLNLLSSALDSQSAYISSKIRVKVQDVLDTLQDPIYEIYKQIQGDEAAPVRLELPSEDDKNQQRLKLVVDFASNRIGVQPSGYLSDSQIHSLALALRLAAIKRCNTSAPLVVLDDIVTSYDADHRRRIAALLASQFDGYQIIVTTHDHRFFIYLKDQLRNADWRFEQIIRLDPDFGPRLRTHRVTEDIIQSRWDQSESAANEIRQAEEEWLLSICRDFGVDVRIRTVDRAYSYDRAELASALAGFLRERSLVPPEVPGVQNRFLTSLIQGAIENFGSHFTDSPDGEGSPGDEQTRWEEFKTFRNSFCCPQCGSTRFKRPISLKTPVCNKENCECQFSFPVAE